MNVVHEEVLGLVQKEHDAATERYGPIASLHEGYAVLLEEVEETEEFCLELKCKSQNFWRKLRYNREEYIESILLSMQKDAIDAACEAIQVAAVCRRILDREDK